MSNLLQQVNPTADQVLVMWDGGPLRRYSLTPKQGFNLNTQGIWVGTYVCSCCLRPVEGVYLYKPGKRPCSGVWLCAQCHREAL